MTQEDKDFIISLANEMQTQDTRCTAQPYGLVITNEHIVSGMDSDYSDLFFYLDRDNDTTYYEEDLPEMIADLEGWMDLDEYKDMLSDIDKYNVNTFYRFSMFCDEYIPSEWDKIGYIVQRTADSTNGCYEGNFFLTEKSAKDYIERNKHNLNKPGTYGVHLYRNPEMERLYDIIFKLAKEYKVD